MDDGAYCIKAQVNKSQEEVKCFDIGQENKDNDNSEFDVEGIDIIIEENSSVNFTIETSIEGNITWDITQFSRGAMVEEYQAQAIPVVLVIDHEGFVEQKRILAHQQVDGMNLIQ